MKTYHWMEDFDLTADTDCAIITRFGNVKGVSCKEKHMFFCRYKCALGEWEIFPVGQ